MIWSVLCGKFDIVHNLVQMCPLLSIVNIKKKYELGVMILSIFCGKFGMQCNKYNFINCTIAILWMMLWSFLRNLGQM